MAAALLLTAALALVATGYEGIALAPLGAAGWILFAGLRRRPGFVLHAGAERARPSRPCLSSSVQPEVVRPSAPNRQRASHTQLLQLALQASGSSALLLFRLDTTGTLWRLQTHVSRSSICLDGLQTCSNAGPLAWVERRQRALRLPLSKRARATLGAAPGLAEHRLAWVAPVSLQPRTRYLLLALYPNSDGPSIAQEDALQNTCALYADHVRRARAARRSRRQAERHQRLLQALRVFEGALTTHDVAVATTQLISRLFAYDLVCLCAWHDQQQRSIDVLADHSIDADWIPDAPFDGRRSVIGACLRHGCDMTFRADGGHHAVLFSPAHAPPVRYARLRPWLWQGKAQAVLIVGTKEDSRQLERDAAMLSAVVEYGAMAMANARLYEDMQRMARTDSLTGLLNHRAFFEQCEAMLMRAQRYHRPTALILMDIDHFKAINDSYGHPFGDHILKEVASVIGQSVRRCDVVARYGGEEFAVLMEETTCQGAVRMAERIRRALAVMRFCQRGRVVTCTLSLGVATFPEDGRDNVSLIAHADEALYAAKRGGRNQVVVFSRMATEQAV